MRQMKWATALLATAILAGCGGSGDSNPRFNSLVSFGDSLSDVGTYSVGTVRAAGGGKYTINGAESKVWIESIAANLRLPAPCPAQTGLNGDPTQGFSVPVTNNPGCTAYAQGGARVTNPVGPGNRLLGGTNAIIGQLTVPVATQIQNYLAANGGSFKGNEAVFVLAGGNDLFIQAATVGAGGDATAAVTAMGTAGAELANYVRTQIVGRGAKYVTVVNLPDVSKTPYALSQPVAAQNLINTMTTTFNAQLRQGLNGVDVLFVDAYTVSRDQATNPGKYGLTNVTAPACDLSPARNPLGSSLICTRNNLAAGTTSTFQFADSVHPTPYSHQLLSDLVITEMAKKGWL